MFKKSIIFLLVFLFVTGCGLGDSNSTKSIEVARKDISCHSDDSDFVLKLENGQIVKYIDSVEGELGQEVVDILNSEHLVGNTDNDNALRIMNIALTDLGGYCE
jgi:hypothetical protein